MNIPTQLTVLRIILTPFFLYTLFLDHIAFKFLSLFIFIVASLTDLYDGYYAKKYGHETKWGKFLDPLADKILVSSALIAFHILGYIHLWVVIVIVVRDFLITGLRSYALYKNEPVVTRELARTKTVVQMTSVYIVFVFLIFDFLFEAQQMEIAFIQILEKFRFLDILMTIVAALTLITGIMYLVENRNHLKSIVIDCYRIFVPLK